MSIGKTISAKDFSKGGNTAIRLTFSYEGNNIQLISKQKIQKILPLSNKKPHQQHFDEVWYELSDNKQQILYSQIINNPIQIDVEIFSNDPKNPITRGKLTDIKGAFSMVIPDIPDAKSLDLFRSTVKPETLKEPQTRITKIIHLDLNELKNGNEEK